MNPLHQPRRRRCAGGLSSRALPSTSPRTGRRRLYGIALFALFASGGAAEAQPGRVVGVLAGIRRVTGAAGGPNDGTQDGVELRGVMERSLRPVVSTETAWRLELAYTQMQKPRVDALGRYSINENGFELGVALKVPVRVALAHAYLIAGPVLTVRAACGVDSHFDSNGRVPCEGERTTATGMSGGLGLRGRAGAEVDWVGEARLMRGTLNAGSGTVLSISAGFQRR